MTATPLPRHGLQLVSTLESAGNLALTLAESPVVEPGPDQVLIRVEAAPINPSDLMTLLPGVDPAAGTYSGTGPQARVSIPAGAGVLGAGAARLDLPVVPGLGGAGTVVAAGANAAHLQGKRVSALSLGAGMFSQYRTVAAAECAPLPDGITAAQGADVFCNPLTALAIAETVRLEKFDGLVHTAAASNLGQMLVKICREDGIPLVNIVRRPQQATLLRELGASHVVDSSAPDFRDELARAIGETGAMVAFDAIGGGNMAHQLLAAMEVAACAKLPGFSPYGSSARKQVYVYGHLDPTPLQLNGAAYGMRWDIGQWASPHILERVGPARTGELVQRILANLTTTFASHYGREVSLAELLDRDTLLACHRQATGGKFLVNPTLS